MATKHTPGPWTWRRVASDGRTVAMILETEHRPVPYNDPVVFALREDWMGELSPAREADKRLIAAAPDLLRERDALKVERDALLAALRGMVDAHDQRTRYLGFAAGSRDDDTTHAARAAIAKAEGAPSLDRYCPCGECGLDRSRWSPECRREAGAR